MAEDDELSRCEWWKITANFKSDFHPETSEAIDGPFFITLKCAMALVRFRRRDKYRSDVKLVHCDDYSNPKQENMPSLKEDYWDSRY